MILKNGTELIIEQAKINDAAHIIEYLKQVGGESDNLLFGAGEFNASVEAEQRLIESYAKSDLSAMFVAKIGNEIVSVAMISAPGRARIAHASELALSVKKSHWGLGIAKHMMQSFIDFARQTGTTEILHLGVKADNSSAIALYKKTGFVEYGVFKDCFKIGGKYFDKILMSLDLRAVQ